MFAWFDKTTKNNIIVRKYFQLIAHKVTDMATLYGSTERITRSLQNQFFDWTDTNVSGLELFQACQHVP